MSPYQPGKPAAELEREHGISNAIKVSSNENSLGASPLALEAAEKALADVYRYPEAGAFYIRKELSERLGVEPNQLVFGGGCNEVIHMLVAAFCTPGDEVLSHDFAFISYKIAALSRGVKFVSAPVTDTLACDVDALIERITDKTRVLFVANPNNPTGQMVSKEGLTKIIDRAPETAVVVIDEAYYEFAKGEEGYGSFLEEVKSQDRLVVLRTFSKAYGLAGLRIGYGVMPAVLAGVMERIRRPFNANSIAQAAAIAALGDEGHVELSAKHARRGARAILEASQKLGLTAHKSYTNFVLVETKISAEEAYKKMLGQSVIVRPMNGWGLPNSVRISVGTDWELKRTIEAMSVLG